MKAARLALDEYECMARTRQPGASICESIIDSWTTATERLVCDAATGRISDLHRSPQSRRPRISAGGNSDVYEAGGLRVGKQRVLGSPHRNGSEIVEELISKMDMGEDR